MIEQTVGVIMSESVDVTGVSTGNWEDDRRVVESCYVEEAPEFGALADSLLQNARNSVATRRVVMSVAAEKAAEWRDMAAVELSCVLMHTSDTLLYEQISSALTQRYNVSLPVKQLITTMLSASRKLPFTKHSVLFRGICSKVDYAKYEVGAVRTWLPFTPTTRRFGNAFTFSADMGATPYTYGTIFVITGALCGHDVQDLSVMKDEREVLLEPCFNFRVLNVIKNGNDKPDFVFIEGINKGLVLKNQLPPKYPFPPEICRSVQGDAGKDIVDLLRRACSEDEYEAQIQLGCLYAQNIRMEENMEEALHWWKKGCHKGYKNAEAAEIAWNSALKGFCGRHKYPVPVSELLAVTESLGKDDAEYNSFVYYTAGCPSFENLKSTADTPAKFFVVGSLMLEGAFVQQNFEAAHEWLNKASKGGHLDMRLAEMLEAAEYGRKAVKGDAASQNMVAVCYESGAGLMFSMDSAFSWYLKAAENGNKDAQYRLGQGYQNGDIAGKDAQKALEWLIKAAKQGHSSAQQTVGEMYYNGKGVEKDLAEAFAWCSKAAEQGVPAGNYIRGICLQRGHGTDVDLEEAFEALELAAKEGFVEAQYEVAECYGKGRGIEKDYDEACIWYAKAADRGHEVSKYKLNEYYVSKCQLEYFDRRMEMVNSGRGFTEQYTKKMYGEDLYNVGRCFMNMKEVGPGVRHLVDAYDQGNMDAACELGKYKQTILCNDAEGVAWYAKGAQNKHPECMYHLALCYEQGKGVEKDLEEAERIMEESAKLGGRKALNYLGVKLLEKGTEDHRTKGIELLTAAADKGDADSQYRVGMVNLSRNKVLALEYFQKAAERGHVGGQYEYGVCYYDGRGVRKDEDKGIVWIRQAAENDFAEAQTKLGDHLLNKVFSRGDGFAWMLKAAKQGHADAEYKVGMCMKTGTGVSKGKQRAAMWLQKAAEQGHVAAMYEIGMCYMTKCGVEKDTVCGINWLVLAAEKEYPDAQYEIGVILDREEDIGELNEFKLGLTEEGRTKKEKGMDMLVRAAVQGHSKAQKIVNSSVRKW